MKVIAYIITPLHILTSLAAIRTRHGSSAVRITFVVHWPGAGLDQLHELHTVVREITDKLDVVDRCIPVSDDTLALLIGQRDIQQAAAELQLLIGSDFREIYYSHDVIGVFYAMLAQSYPNAERVCFGDGLGIVYERRHHLSLMDVELPPDPEPIQPSPPANQSFLRRLVDVVGINSPEKLGLSPLQNWPRLPFGVGTPPPSAAALVLPVDQSGHFLRNVPWLVAPRSLVLDLLEQLSAQCAEFQRHVDNLLERGGSGPKYLLLTENGAEGHFIEFEKDVEMYCTVIEQFCLPGSVVYLKSHPGETLPRNDAIRSQLGDRFSLQPFDARFKRYPIEFAGRLVRECIPICMSYPRLSIKYLFGLDVIQPMDDAFIERWYPERYWLSFKNARSLYEEPFRRLRAWNGNTILWSGNDAEEGEPPNQAELAS